MAILPAIFASAIHHQIMRYFTLVSFIFLMVSCSTTNYYLVRHAEKMDDSKDPPLSKAGIDRANALKDSLLNAGIDLLYATPYLRTQQTVKPLADALHKQVISYDAGKTLEFVEELKKINNENVVIAGHSNTVSEMVLFFTGDTVRIGHDDYDNLFFVRKKKSLFSEKYVLKSNKYGN